MPLEYGLVELQPQTWLLGYRQQAVLHRRRLLPEAQRPRHVLDGQVVGDRGDQVDVNLRDDVAHDRQIGAVGDARGGLPAATISGPTRVLSMPWPSWPS